MKNQKLNTIALLLFVLLAAASTLAQTAEIQPMSGGSFTMTQSVIAAGGATQQNVTSLHGTIGQPVAGSNLTGNQFQHYTGFLLPDSFGRTVVLSAVIGGQVLNAEGKGIRNVLVTITFPSGETQTVKTGAAGYYRFTDIPTGKNYVITVSANRFAFGINTQTRTIVGDTQDINFIAETTDSIEKEETKQ
jgi:hypothetical protein